MCVHYTNFAKGLGIANFNHFRPLGESGGLPSRSNPHGRHILTPERTENGGKKRA
jgi:hypothetical protein